MRKEYRLSDSPLPESVVAVSEWIDRYLGRPNEDSLKLRRKVICSFIPGALQKDSVLFVLDEDATDADATEAAVLEYRERFHKMEPEEGHGVRFKTIVVIFPNVSSEVAPDAIDEVQRKLKYSTRVDFQMMIGELHPTNETPAADDPTIFPNRSPVPLLALRSIVGRDHMFLFPKEPLDELSDEEQVVALEYQVAYYQAAIRCSNESERKAKGPRWEREIADARTMIQAIRARAAGAETEPALE